MRNLNLPGDLPESRRRQLIEATARSLARHGLDGTTVRVVAAEAGVSPGLVRHHFAGMHDLIAETYRWTGKEVEKALRAALSAAPNSPEGQLRAFVDASWYISGIAEERRLDLDARLAALAFTALLDGLWLEHCLDPTTFTAVEARLIAHDWVDNLKAGRFMATARAETVSAVQAKVG
ncbi:MAG: TetR family transcriptional regulator [Rhodospirillaceae bacterium]|nr:TetR family transcriptional regulator [Rhodospirillaceae bacterium]